MVKSTREIQMVMAMAAGLSMSNMYSNPTRQSGTYIRPSGATVASKKKRKAQSKARKKNQKKK